MTLNETYEFWLNNPYFDTDTRQELASIAGDEVEITERFYKNLEFGTGGLRGIIGAGTNRMNIYTVRKATQGLANYIQKQSVRSKTVAIAYDSRNMSSVFAEEAALCLNANQINTCIFPSLRPTPMLSFAIRELGCTAGIVITASHNPAEYNGYKVYWTDGAQITAPRDKILMDEINAVTDFSQVKTMSREAAEKDNLYHVISSEIDDKYMASLKTLILHPEVLKTEAPKLRIVYTPLHGTGNHPVRRILEETGFIQVYVVKEQELPDGNFPTVSSPNPENPEAFSLALKLAKQVDADLVLATDPDADRLGLYAKDYKTGEYKSFSGNMTGAFLLYYIVSQKKALGTLAANSAVVTTIVSGKMAREIAADYNVECMETLTGFKYIGEQIHIFEKTKKYEYLFGYEESYGCLVGTYVRDKDAIVAAMVLCEAAAWYKYHNISLPEQMEFLFETYGYYKESLTTITREGRDGISKINRAMDEIRRAAPRHIGGIRVIQFRDYLNNRILDFMTDQELPANLPASNVIYFELEDKSWCCIRPSGTEPKIKIYIGVVGSNHTDASQRLTSITDILIKMLEGCL